MQAAPSQPRRGYRGAQHESATFSWVWCGLLYHVAALGTERQRLDRIQGRRAEVDGCPRRICGMEVMKLDIIGRQLAGKPFNLHVTRSVVRKRRRVFSPTRTEDVDVCRFRRAKVLEEWQSRVEGAIPVVGHQPMLENFRVLDHNPLTGLRKWLFWADFRPPFPPAVAHKPLLSALTARKSDPGGTCGVKRARCTDWDAKEGVELDGPGRLGSS